MDDDQYLTYIELEQIARLCRFLNDEVHDVGFGAFEILDTNGEVCGYINCGDAGYAYYPNKPLTPEAD